MKFEVGETVVYPHHGAAEIIEVAKMNFRGELTECIHLKVLQSQHSPLTIWIPKDKVQEVGIRDVIDKKGVKQVFEVLRAEFTEEPTNWSRRFKANGEKLKNGDVFQVSEVVRDLWRRDRENKGLSTGEKNQYQKARNILVSELALAMKVNEEKAQAELDKVLAS